MVTGGTIHACGWLGLLGWLRNSTICIGMQILHAEIECIKYIKPASVYFWYIGNSSRSLKRGLRSLTVVKAAFSSLGRVNEETVWSIEAEIKGKIPCGILEQQWDWEISRTFLKILREKRKHAFVSVLLIASLRFPSLRSWILLDIQQK